MVARIESPVEANVAWHVASGVNESNGSNLTYYIQQNGAVVQVSKFSGLVALCVVVVSMAFVGCGSSTKPTPSADKMSGDKMSGDKMDKMSGDKMDKMSGDKMDKMSGDKMDKMSGDKMDKMSDDKMDKMDDKMKDDKMDDKK